MKKRFLIAFFVAAAAGSALHFFYGVLPNPLTALISPINESIWEHLKLLFWPTLIAAWVLSMTTEEKVRLWSGFLLAELVMPVFLLCAFYLLKCAFQVENLLVDLGLYFLTMAGGFLLAFFAAKSRKLEAAAPWLLLPVMLYGASLILFTFAAPQLPVFQPPVKP